MQRGTAEEVLADVDDDEAKIIINMKAKPIHHQLCVCVFGFDGNFMHIRKHTLCDTTNAK